MSDFKDYLIATLLTLAIVAIVCGLSFLIVCVSYWFIIPAAIFTILCPWFLWKIADWIDEK